MPLRDHVEIELGLAWSADAIPTAFNFIKVARRASRAGSPPVAG